MKEGGFTLVEILVSLAIVGTISSAIAVKLKADKRVLDETSRLMAQDALEVGMGDFIKSREVVEYSIKQSKNTALINCVINQMTCTHNSSFEATIYRLGDRQALTGPTVLYDGNGKPCPGKCTGYYFRTSIQVACSSGSQCPGPAYVLIRADIFRTDENKPIRSVAREMERHANAKFPNISLRCKDNSSVLRGISSTGGALCTPLQAIKFLGGKGSTVEVKPVDCREKNSDSSDQSFVHSINEDGDVRCSRRFW